MRRATLNLNETTYKQYTVRELESNWHDYPVIKLWLKIRKFDLSLPISVITNYKENSITFTQAAKNLHRNVIVVHPNPQILDQISHSLIKAGHKVTGFQKAKLANIQIETITENNFNLDCIIIPANMKVAPGCTYKNYLNRRFPDISVLTTDKNNYRETLNIKEL